jgi:riboflavin-specific deaminase-like protein
VAPPTTDQERTLRQLPSDPDPSLSIDDAYAGLTLPDGTTGPDGTPRGWVALGMVASVDGAGSLAGRTDQLGGEADRHAFSRLRGACDAILVGAGTVRAEDYGPPRGTAARREDRRRRGLAPAPRLVVVTGSLSLDPGARLFADPDHRPLVATHAQAPASARAALAEVAEVVDTGTDTVDLGVLLGELARRGLGRVLCEGGPTLNGALLTADLVDEVFLTVAPVALGGGAPRIATGDTETHRELELVSVVEHGHELLLRYQVRR